jgi:hypothetical protein
MSKNVGLKRDKGQAIISVVLFFLVISSTVVFGLSGSIFRLLLNSLDYFSSRQSFYLADSMAEDVVYRYIKGLPIASNLSMSLNQGQATASTIDLFGVKQVTIKAEKGGLNRKIRLNLSYGQGGSFFFGVQVGEGGLWMYNSSEVLGNVHSSGPVKGVGNYIRGDVLSAGTSGIIENVHATSSAFAHTIKDSIVDKDAYYKTIVNSTVSGTLYPNSPDQATTSLPISDEQIDEWEIDAQNGGTVTCTNGQYVINSNTTIGPKKIPCDLVIQSNPTITISGALWVVGDITFTNNPIIRVSPIYTNVTIPLIAHNPADTLNSSRVILQNNTVFQGSGNNSYLILIARNESASQGGAIDSISMANSVSGEVILYSPHGNVTMDNYVNLREVTSYKVTLRNSAKVIYKSGLANVLFTSGPSGGFELTDWKEVY